jgi:hypothetical protein
VLQRCCRLGGFHLLLRPLLLLTLLQLLLLGCCAAAAVVAAAAGPYVDSVAADHPLLHLLLLQQRPLFVALLQPALWLVSCWVLSWWKHLMLHQQEHQQQLQAHFQCYRSHQHLQTLRVATVAAVEAAAAAAAEWQLGCSAVELPAAV